MPSPNQAMDGRSDPYEQAQNLVSERRRTDSDKSNLGIPSDDNAWFGATSSVPSNSQGSWETISHTSHSPSVSIVDEINTQQYRPEHGVHPPTMPQQAEQHIQYSGEALDQCWTPDPSLDFSHMRPSSYPMLTHAQTASPGLINSIDGNLFCHGGMSVINVVQDIDYDLGAHRVQTNSFGGLQFSQGFQGQEPGISIEYSCDNIVPPVTSAYETTGPRLVPLVNRPELECGTTSNVPTPVHPDQNTNSEGSPVTPGSHAKRFDATSSSQRHNIDEINVMRDTGACLPCKLLHEKCGQSDESNGLCPRCLRLVNDMRAKIWQGLPCTRDHLKDVEVHRTVALSFPTGIPKLQWEKQPQKIVTLFNVGFADTSEDPSSRPQLQIPCSRFHPSKQHPLQKSWLSRGQKVDLPLPPFAIKESNLPKINKKLDSMLDEHYAKLLSELPNGQDEILSMIIVEASRHSQESKAIEGALRIAIITRLILKSFNLIGHEQLGIDVVWDSDSPYNGRIPIPPVMDAQLDQLWMDKMVRVRKKALSQLNDLIFGKKRKQNWYSIFLAILVLLINLESIYQNQERQRQRYQKNPLQQENMMSNWKHAAETLKWHFRTVCHGESPLNMKWTEEARKVAEVDWKALDFLANLKHSLELRVHDLQKRANEPPHVPLVWIAALFLPDSHNIH